MEATLFFAVRLPVLLTLDLMVPHSFRMLGQDFTASSTFFLEEHRPAWWPGPLQKVQRICSMSMRMAMRPASSALSGLRWSRAC